MFTCSDFLESHVIPIHIFKVILSYRYFNYIILIFHEERMILAKSNFLDFGDMCHLCSFYFLMFDIFIHNVTL